MQKNPLYVKRIYTTAYLLLVALMVIYVVFFTDFLGDGLQGRMQDYSDGWTVSGSEKLSLSEIEKQYHQYLVTIEKRLPEVLRDGDCFCFESRNVNVTVWIGDRELYHFETRDNLSGRGYGFASHEIGLDRSQAGETIRICYEGAYPTHYSGYLSRAYICSAADYMRLMVRENIFSLVLSVMMLFLGAVLVIFWIVMPGRSNLPFDILALGIMAVMMGVWSALDTGLFSLFSGGLFAERVLSRLLLPMVLYPFFVFIHSLTLKKRPIYRSLIFYSVLLTLAGLIFARYFLYQDMIHSYAYAMIALMVVLMSVILIMTIDEVMSCRKEGKSSKFPGLLPGIVIMGSCGIIEGVTYFLHLIPSRRYFGFLRLGTVGFIISVFVLFLKWWLVDRDVVERDQFINRALQFSSSSNSIEESIRLLMEYIGTEFQLKRVCFFEKGGDGTYKGSYEWCGNSLEYMRMDSLTVSEECLRERTDGKHHCVLIGSREQCAKEHPQIAELMEQRGIDSIVSGELEVKGSVVGVLELQDPSVERIEEIKDVMDVLSYFFARFVHQQKEQERILYYSYHDDLTGARNLTAYREYTERQMDLSLPFGYLMCEVEIPEKLNEVEGFEAGNGIIRTVAQKLMDIFGEKNVYHFGGGSFAVFGFETDETFFRNDVARARHGIRDGKCDYYFGEVYCSNGAQALETIHRKASELLNAERESMMGNK